MNSPAELSLLVHGLALAVPAVLALVAVVTPRRALAASGGALGMTLLVTLGAGLTSGAPGEPPLTDLVRVDAVTCVTLLLVSAFGLVIVRYSQTYLRGEQGLTRYLRWLLLTLAAVTALVVTNDLLVLAFAWTSTSLALHQLLTFYADRPAALVAAHKKFLVSRLADLCLLVSLALVLREVGSLNLDRIAAWVQSQPELTLSMHVAAVALVLAVALKSAQLPFHGWLTQVMEAPTPVSALLHAGVVNIGGFVLIRVAPWLEHAELARLLLVFVGLTTAVVGALVMTTRVSVKVALAWSTCAQLGFMLVECGLGLWHLALLHLVAHSLYKAHAFLSAGTAVDGWRAQALAARPPPPSWARLGASVLLATGVAALGFAGLRSVFQWSPTQDFAAATFALLLSLSLVPLLARPVADRATRTALAARVAGVVLLSLAWHLLAGKLITAGEVSFGPGWVLALVGLTGLFAVKTTLQLAPEGRLARALYPWLFAGFYLDEHFTRLTFRLWPPRLPRPSRAAPAVDLHARLEVQP